VTLRNKLNIALCGSGRVGRVHAANIACSPGFEDGTAALILADAAAESAATGKPVTVEGARQ
jgi:predicted dehydrogenase